PIAPDTEGNAVNKKSCSVLNEKPTLGKFTATALKIIQTQKDNSRQGIEIHKFRFAMYCP
ncbi:hypothetical protein, partial [Vibrio parahaemolyticus]|uniref:hypothetical protein n=1 Tax=Vibrio parahaemolyticus TaxID=670 RepID=UPI0027E4FD89